MLRNPVICRPAFDRFLVPYRPTKQDAIFSCVAQELHLKYNQNCRGSNIQEMASENRLVSWDRLVRYVPEGEDSQVRFGEPILQQGRDDDVGELARKGKLIVKVLTGDDVFQATPTSRVDKVKKLLGPLAVHDVPIIRCIGLNYKTHST